MNTRTKISNMTHIALYTVVLIVCSWISVPLAVPVTMQTFGVFFLFYFAGGKKAVSAIVLYIALGAIGVPVFSGFGAGLSTLIGPTGGYIFGFLAAGGVYISAESILKEKIEKRSIRAFVTACALLTCYTLGAWTVARYGTLGASGYVEVLKSSVVIYGIPDILKSVLASFLADYMKRIKA